MSTREEIISSREAASKIDSLVLGQERMVQILAELQQDVQGLAGLLASCCGTKGADAPGLRPAEASSPRHCTSASSVGPISERLSKGGELLSVVSQDSTDTQVAPSLPLRWPASLGMRQGPDMEPRRSSYTCSSTRLDVYKVRTDEGVHSTSSRFTADIWGKAALRERLGIERLMISPISNFHAAYSVFAFAVLMFDLSITSYVVAWEFGLHGFFEATAWASCVFWSLDLLISFLTGYTESDRLEMRPRCVAAHFARTWLLPDLAFLTCDWVSLVLGYRLEGDGPSSSFRLVRIVKLGKLLRAAGFNRVLKVARVLDEIMDTSSALVKVMLRCLAFFLAIVWLNHLVGCAWFAVGKMAPTDTGIRWTQSAQVNDGVTLEFMEAGFLYQYITSVHWSMAQFTLGSIEIGCFNTFERMFNIACLTLGLLFGSTLVSILSAAMVEYQMMRQDQTQKLRTLRRFLRENSVNSGLANLVQQQARERFQAVDKIQEKDVTVLELLSRSLRMDLRFEIAQPHLCSHPLFRLWSVMDSSTVRSVCNEAMENTWLLPQDDLFVAGTTTDRAYLLVSGRLDYMQSPKTSAVGTAVTTPVEVGTWISEASLWSHWIHVGTVKASTSSQSMVLLAERMMAVLRRNRDVCEIVLEYRRLYHSRLVVARPPEYAWPTDLEVPCTEYSDLVFSMDREVQMAIGLIALRHLVDSSWHRVLSRSIAKLKQEVLNGRCCVMMNSAGQIERVVSVLALHIEGSGGSILVELGQASAAATKASCQLPGVKVDQGELASEALERALARIRVPRAEILIGRAERHTHWQRSQESGVQTRYLRSVHFGELVGQLDLATLTVPPATLESEGLPPECSQTRVHVSADGAKRLFYAWLQPQLYDRLRSPEGESDLQSWVAALARCDTEEREV